VVTEELALRCDCEKEGGGRTWRGRSSSVLNPDTNMGSTLLFRTTMGTSAIDWNCYSIAFGLDFADGIAHYGNEFS